MKDGRVDIIKIHCIEVCKQVQGIYFYLKCALEFEESVTEISILHHKKIEERQHNG